MSTEVPARRDWADIVAELTARQTPCPDCGVPMIGARCYEPGYGAYLGLVCVPCDERAWAERRRGR